MSSIIKNHNFCWWHCFPKLTGSNWNRSEPSTKSLFCSSQQAAEFIPRRFLRPAKKRAEAVTKGSMTTASRFLETNSKIGQHTVPCTQAIHRVSAIHKLLGYHAAYSLTCLGWEYIHRATTHPRFLLSAVILVSLLRVVKAAFECYRLTCTTSIIGYVLHGHPSIPSLTLSRC